MSNAHPTSCRCLTCELSATTDLQLTTPAPAPAQYDDRFCDACQMRPRGWGHWGMYCVLCSKQPYGLYVTATGHVAPIEPAGDES